MKRFNFFTLSSIALATVLIGTQLCPARDASPIDLARQLNEAFIQVADQASSSVVVIKIVGKAASDEDSDSPLWDALPPEFRKYWDEHKGRRGNAPRKFEGEGSGILVTADGYILTNNHVVENADKITVRFKDGTEYQGVVKGADPESDVAVVKISATGLKPAKLGNSDTTRVGEFVLAIGAPFALSYSVTFGHVSAKSRTFENSGYSGYSDQDFIQTDASINPGNSGGPLVNLYGEVVAINTMIEGMNTGIGFAIPINLARRVMDHLINEGKYTRSYLGITIGDLRDDPDYLALESKLAPDTKDGVEVRGILPRGPAAKSELRAGDVITSVDAKPIATSRELKQEISIKPPGHVIVLNVVRASEHLTIKVAVAALPDRDELAEDVTPAHPAQEEAVSFGLTIQPMSKSLATEYKIDEISGVVVTSVETDSVAEASDIKVGDVITEINRKRVANPRQFRDAMKSSSAKNGVMMNLVSHGVSRFVVLKNDEK
ncbi:MAG TPA: trypsin-like peptidase domain-containing protein [Verrucomicrobiae bacterium]